MSACLSQHKARLLDLEIVRLTNLLIDLRSLRSGVLPEQSVLEKSPMIECWSLGERPVRCLTGFFIDHPKIDDGSPGLTSDLFFIDVNHGFARTRSRFYRLGSPA